MRLPRQINNSFLPLLLLAAQQVCAQLAPADDFFNSGAQFYISNNIPAALERTESGLQLYPDDEKLQKLEKLLKQRQQQQNQQNQNQQNQSQQSQQPQQNSNDQKQQQQNQQEQSSQKNSQSQQKQDEQKQSQSGDKKDGEKPEDKNVEGQSVAPGQMTPEEAKRLLDAQRGDEQVLQLKPQGKPPDNQKPVKDW